jgi:hypothetical protein
MQLDTIPYTSADMAATECLVLASDSIEQVRSVKTGVNTDVRRLQCNEHRRARKSRLGNSRL